MITFLILSTQNQGIHVVFLPFFLAIHNKDKTNSKIPDYFASALTLGPGSPLDHPFAFPLNSGLLILSLCTVFIAVLGGKIPPWQRSLALVHRASCPSLALSHPADGWMCFAPACFLPRTDASANSCCISPCTTLVHWYPFPFLLYLLCPKHRFLLVCHSDLSSRLLPWRVSQSWPFSHHSILFLGEYSQIFEFWLCWLVNGLLVSMHYFRVEASRE